MKKLLLLSTLMVGLILESYAQCTSASSPTPQMGAMMNPQYVNLWKQCPAEDKFGEEYGTSISAVSIGDDGWPVAGVTHQPRFYARDVYPLLNSGEILKIRYKGPASAFSGASPWQLTYQNIQANTPTTGYTTLEAVIGAGFPVNGNNGIVIEFDGHIEDIQIIRPGYNFDDPRLLVDEYVTHVQTVGWKAFRFMGLSGVNGSYDMTWPKRLSKNAPISVNVFQTSMIDPGNTNWTKTNGMNEDATRAQMGGGRQRGTSWEDQIDICNYLNIDMWANIPVLAEDSYIVELAKLIKDRLKPNLNVNVEIGNEIWNRFGLTFMSGYFMTQRINWDFYNGTADQKKIFGGSYCPGCGLTSDYENGAQDIRPNAGRTTNYNGGPAYDTWQRWQAQRLKDHAESFATIFGWKESGGDVGNRIRMILAGQVGYGSEGMAWNIGPGLEYLMKAYGPFSVKKYIYATAVTFYHAPAPPLDNQGRTAETLAEYKAISVSEINNRLNHELDFNQFGEFSFDGGAGPTGTWFGNTYEGVFAKSKVLGLKMYAYEGGNEMSSMGACFYNRFNGSSEGCNSWQAMDNGDAWFNSAGSQIFTTRALNKWFGWFGYDALFMKQGDYQESPLSGYAISRTLNESNGVRNSYTNVSNSATPPLDATRGNIIGAVTTTTLDARKHACYRPQGGFYDSQVAPPAFNPTATGAAYPQDVKFVSGAGGPNPAAGWQPGYIYEDNTFRVPMIIRCTKNGTYKIDFLVDEYSWNKVADFYLNDQLITNFTLTGSNALTVAESAVDQYGNNKQYRWATASVTLDIPYGVHLFRIVPTMPVPGGASGGKFGPGSGDSGYGCGWGVTCAEFAVNEITLRKYRFTLVSDLPPFQPKPVIGEVNVCNGNSKATYEVGENDPSVCEYRWSIPAGVGASILPNASITGSSPVKYSSGPNMFKTQLDWTGVPNGTYTLSVAGWNQNAFSVWQSSPVRTFQVVVTSCGFDYTPAPTCLTDRVTFTPLITPNEKAWRWDFDFNTIPNTLATRFQDTKFPTTIQWSTPGVKSVEYTVTTNTITGTQLKFFKTINVFDCTGPTITGFSKIADATTCVAIDGQIRINLSGANLANGQVYQIDLDGNGSFGSALDGQATLTGFSANTGVLNINTIAAGRTITGIPNMRVRLTTDFSKISPNYSSSTLIIGPVNGGMLTLNGSLGFCTAGSTLLTVTGATNYAWSNGGTGNTKTYNSAGTFTVSGTTAGCVMSSVFTTSVVSAPTVVATGTKSLCNGGSTLLTATGASSYIWTSGSTPSSITNTFNPSSTTQVTLTGFVGSCSDVDIFIVTVNSLPVVGITAPSTICSGLSTTLTASGGGTYLWSNGVAVNTTTLSPLSTTNYTVTVTSGLGCSNITTTSITVNANPTVTGTGTKAICVGSSTLLTGSGATSYTWTSGSTPSSTTNTFNPIANTVVTITGTAGLCVDTDIFTITVNSLPIVGITAPTTICSGTSSNIVVSGGGTYLWSNGVAVNTTTLSPVSTTNYTVTVTSGLGCKNTTTTSISVNASPTSNAPTRTHITNCGSADGTISLSATGGVSPYLFSTNNFATSNGTGVFGTLSAGTYTGFIRNGSGPTCTATVVGIVITTPSLPNIPTFAKTDVTSCVSSNGGLTITGSGGTSPYEYSRDNGASWQTARSYTGLGAVSGTIAIRSLGFNACSITGAAYNITATGSPSIASTSKTDISNCGLTNGSITIVGTGASSYEYTFDNGATWVTTSISSGLTNGTKTLGIRNAITPSCSITGTSVTLTTPSAPVFTNAVTQSPTNCSVSDGQIAITAIAGSTALQYSINSGGTWTATNNNTALAAGAYGIYLRNTGGTCTVFGQNLTLTAPNLTPTVSYGASAYCNNTNIGTTSGTNLSGGIFKISPTGASINAGNGTIASGATANIYNVVYTIAGAGFCTGATSGAALVTITAPALAGSVSGGSTPITLGASTGTMNLTGYTGTVVNWQVSYNAGLFTNITTATGTSYSETPAALGSYQYRVVVSGGVCANVTSTGQTINVNGAGGGVNGAGGSFCAGTILPTMTLSGALGTVTNWQYTINGGASVYVTNTTSLLSGFVATVAGNYSFTASVSGSGLSTAYNTVVDASPISGTLSPLNSTICSGVGYTLNLGSQTGTIVKWSSSIDGGTTWTAIANNTGTSYATSAIQTTQYVVEVSNGSCVNATTSSAMVTIDQPSVGGTVTGVSSSISLGTSIGTLSTSGSTGIVIGYQKSYNGGAFTAATNNETPSAVGVYEYRAIVQNGVCISTTSSTNYMITVTGSVGNLTTVPSPVVLNGAFTPISIVGLNGTVTNWEYSTDNGATWTNIANTTSGLGVLPTGTYNVENTWQIRANISGLGYTNPLSIAVHGVPNIGSVSKTDVSNCGLTDGTITINATGNHGLEYSLNGSTWTSTGTNTCVFTGLSNATYPIYVRNASSTFITTSGVSQTITTPSAPTISGTSKTDVSACGLTDGQIVINATGGTGARQYSVDNFATVSTTSAMTNLTNNTYTVYVRNANSTSCMASLTGITLTAPGGAVAGSINGAGQNTCSGFGTTLTLINSTGTIEWQSSTVSSTAGFGNVATASTSYATGALTSTTYYRAILSNGSCASQTTVGVAIMVKPILTPSVAMGIAAGTNTICSGTSVTFTITSAMNGGTPSYQWKLNNANIGTGTSYTSSTLSHNDVIKVELTSSELCVSTPTATSAGITMSVQAAPNTSLVVGPTTQTVCASTNATITVSSAQANTIYQLYQVNASGNETTVGGSQLGTGNQTFTVSSVASGMTNYKIKANNSVCTTPVQVGSQVAVTGVSQPAQPTLSIVGSQVTKFCKSGNDPVIESDVIGGTFSGIGVQQLLINNQASIALTNALVVGDSPITVTYKIDNGYCQPKEKTIVVNIDAPLVVSNLSYDGMVKCKEATLKLNPAITNTGAVFAASGKGLSINASTGTIDLAASSVGSYTITLTAPSFNTCPPVPKFATLTIVSATVGSISSTDLSNNNQACEGTPVNLELSAYTGDKVEWQQLSATGYVSVGNSKEYKATNLAVGTYTYQVVATKVGCTTPAIANKTIEVIAQTKPGVIGAQKSIICDETSTQVSITGNGGVIKQWETTDDTTKTDSWTVLTSAKTDNVFNTPFMITYGQVAYFRAKVQNGNSCQIKATNVAKVQVCDLNNFTPNALTPDTYNENSVWLLDNLKLTSASVIRVYNRYGTEVYQAKGDAYKSKPWDGGGLPAGTYYYVINRNDGQTKELTGAITVIK